MIPAAFTGAVVWIDKLVAVLFNQALHIGRDDVILGFFPANALEFAFTARPNWFIGYFRPSAGL